MSIRLNKVIKEFNVGLQTVVDFLAKKGHKVNASPSEKIDDAQYELLRKEFGSDKDLKNEAEKLFQDRQKEKEKEKAQKKAAAAAEMIETTVPEELRPKVVVKGTVDLNPKPAPAPTPAPAPAPAEQEEPVSAPATPEPTPAPEPEPAPEPTPAPAPEAETVATGESKAESDAPPSPLKARSIRKNPP